MSAYVSPRMLLFIVLVATMAIQTLASNSLFVIPAIAPTISEDLNLPTTFIGYQVSIVYLGAMVISAVAGSVTLKWGPVRTAQVGLLLGAGGLSLATIHTVPTFIVASLITGVGYGLINPPSVQMLEKVSTPANRSTIFSIKQTAVPIGGITAGLIGPPLALLYSWEVALAVSAAFSVAMIFLIQPLAKRFDTEADRDRTTRLGHSPFRDIGLVWSILELRWLALSAFCFAAVQFTLTTYLVTLLVKDVRLGLVAAGVSLSVFQISAISGRLGWGVLADASRAGMATLLSAYGLAVLATLPLIWMNSTWSLTEIYIALAVLGASGAGWNGVFIGYTINRAPPKAGGRAIGGAFAFTFAGALLGPSIFASAHGWLGLYTHTAAVITLFALAGLSFGVLAAYARQGANRKSVEP